MTHRAVVFDLDGTLTSTTEIDSLCFVEAIEAEFGFTPDSDWSRYRWCTDEGIALEALAARFGRTPSPQELERLKRRFFGLLGATSAAMPSRFEPLDGSLELLRELLARGWIVCIATGSWRTSASIKITAAGVPTSIPVFASDGVPARETILASAVRHAQSLAPVPLARVVAVGDGVWDVAAAAALELPFVGVAVGDRAAVLREAGARVVVPDYRDLGETLGHLESAPAPSRSGAVTSPVFRVQGQDR